MANACKLDCVSSTGLHYQLLFNLLNNYGNKPRWCTASVTAAAGNYLIPNAYAILSNSTNLWQIVYIYTSSCVLLCFHVILSIFYWPCDRNRKWSKFTYGTYLMPARWWWVSDWCSSHHWWWFTLVGIEKCLTRYSLLFNNGSEETLHAHNILASREVVIFMHLLK